MSKDKNYHRDGADFLIVNGRVIPVIGTLDAETGEVEFDTKSKKEHIARITPFGFKEERKPTEPKIVEGSFEKPSSSQSDS